jgi:hypothetical protein
MVDLTRPQTSGLCQGLNYDLSQVKSRKQMGEDCSNANGTVDDFTCAVGTVTDIAYAVGLMHEIAYRGKCLHFTLGSGTGPLYKYLRADKPSDEEATSYEALLRGLSDYLNQQLCLGTQREARVAHYDLCEGHLGGLELSRGGQAVKTDGPDRTLKPPAIGQDWVLTGLSSLELPRQEDNKSISELQGLFLPDEEVFGLGLLDAVIEDLLSWEGRKIVGCLDDKTTGRKYVPPHKTSCCCHAAARHETAGQS